MLIDIIAGARPNFMKIAPIIEELKNRKNPNLKWRLIHTGQHYDKNMSGSFFRDLNIPAPDQNLEVGSGTQAEQTGKIMYAYEQLLQKEKCDLTLVVGDVNSTMSCAISAKKAVGIKVAHVEGGIRSNDLSMPEEINRMVTDSISDYFYTTSATANENLLKLGVGDERIRFVGNTMIDTLLKNLPRLKKPEIWEKLHLENKRYLVLTLHRPSNVDSQRKLAEILRIVSDQVDIPLIFPVHPRTKSVLEQITTGLDQIYLTDPLGYLEFNYLVRNSKGVLTDSGGITEETTVMGVPCITLRENTERPETCEIGSNVLVGADHEKLRFHLKKLDRDEWKKGSIPPLWDGKASIRIVDHLEELQQQIG